MNVTGVRVSQINTDMVDEFAASAQKEITHENIGALTRRDVETGLIDISAHDEAANLVLKDGSSQSGMMVTLFKIMLLLHYNSDKCHKENAIVEKKLIRTEMQTIRATYNGYLAVGLKTAGALITLGSGLASLQPGISKESARMLLKQGHSFAMLPNAFGDVAKESNEGHRMEGQTTKQILDSDHSESRRMANREQETTSSLLQLWQQAQQREHQIKADIASSR